MKKALITFVKAPVPGTVKTRLQADLGAEKTVEVYKTFVAEIVSQCARLKGIDRILGCAPSVDHDFFIELTKKHNMKSFSQCGADLGERIVNAFKDHFKKGFSEIVLIGSDSPTIPMNYIRKAFTSLGKNDFVLGPCCDGGLYLIGAKKKIVPEIFNNIQWDSSKVLNQTLDNIGPLDIKLSLLPFWYDVDTIAELTFMKKHLKYLNRKLPLPAF
ncbi:MAG: TIGR04282 family arsenosugar biosynthesis glycosyltransferase [Nitrospirae bacterium]|nr:TIGR04282 family arsenosugar biosynthesis glycosyltransferase [Nitrospirota bacterium]